MGDNFHLKNGNFFHCYYLHLPLVLIAEVPPKDILGTSVLHLFIPKFICKHRLPLFKLSNILCLFFFSLSLSCCFLGRFGAREKMILLFNTQCKKYCARQFLHSLPVLLTRTLCCRDSRTLPLLLTSRAQLKPYLPRSSLPTPSQGSYTELLSQHKGDKSKGS